MFWNVTCTAAPVAALLAATGALVLGAGAELVAAVTAAGLLLAAAVEDGLAVLELEEHAVAVAKAAVAAMTTK